MSTADADIAALERMLAELMQSVPPDHPDLALARNNLAIRNLGQVDRAKALYADVRVCEHLEPVRRSLLDGGATITYAGQPWSRNCRTWIYFDVVIDPAGLKERFALPACVVAHSHRGTHDGSEQGIVCETHKDGLMGPHPAA